MCSRYAHRRLPDPRHDFGDWQAGTVCSGERRLQGPVPGKRSNDVRPAERDRCVPDLEDVVVPEEAKILGFLPKVADDEVGFSSFKT
jgi:hypothetical protein